MNNLTEEQKENIQTAFLHKTESALQEKIALKKKYAKTSKDYFEVLTLELARPVCNNCTSIIPLYDMANFYRNGGYCPICEAKFKS